MSRPPVAARGGRSRLWTRVLAGLGPAGLIVMPIGALGSRWGLWHYTRGLAIVGAGIALAIVALIGGAIGLLVARRKDMARDVPRLRFALGAGLGTLVLLGMQPGGRLSAPPIHDISTDLDDPPQFVTLPEYRGQDANPLVRSDRTAALQIEAYPWVQPLFLDVSSNVAFQAAAFLAEDMGLDIVDRDLGSGRIEAVATTFWFGFKDDVVIRVTPEPGGSRVDMRSVSRVGQGDLGTNADRIGEFLEALAESVREDQGEPDR